MTNWYGYPYIALTGGADGALDSLDGSLLKGGDFAVVVVPSSKRTYVYSLDEDSAAAEDGINVISPDSNPGDKRWVLTNTPYSEHDVTYYGAGTGESAAVNTAAFAAAVAANDGGYITFPGGTFLGRLVISGSTGIKVFGNNSVIKGPSSGATAGLLEIFNSTGVHVQDLYLNGDYNVDLTAGVHIYAEAASAASYCTLKNVNPQYCKIGFKFGHASYVDALCSENTVIGGFTFGCPIAAQAIGTQTVAHFTGYTLKSDTASGTTPYLALDMAVAQAIGGYINITGGECLITSDSDQVCFNVQPITSAAYSNPYGTISVVNSVVESASQLATATNPTPISSPTSGMIRIIGCTGYHSQNSFSFIQTAADYAGRVIAKDNNFYAGVSRTQKNIECGNNSTNVYCDDHSFGVNFIAGLDGITGGTAHFTQRQVLRASVLGSMQLSASNTTDLVFISVSTTGDLGRFSACYNTSDGIFTVPTGGLKNVQVRGQLINHNAAATSEYYVKINNDILAASVLHTLAGQISYSISSLNANDTIKLSVLNNGNTCNVANSSLDQFDIFASN